MNHCIFSLDLSIKKGGVAMKIDWTLVVMTVIVLVSISSFGLFNRWFLVG